MRSNGAQRQLSRCIDDGNASTQSRLSAAVAGPQLRERAEGCARLSPGLAASVPHWSASAAAVCQLGVMMLHLLVTARASSTGHTHGCFVVVQVKLTCTQTTCYIKPIDVTSDITSRPRSVV